MEFSVLGRIAQLTRAEKKCVVKDTYSQYLRMQLYMEIGFLKYN